MLGASEIVSTWFPKLTLVLGQLVAMLGAPAAAPAEVFANAECLGCHEREGAEWSGSQHRTAFTEATFQAALEREPQAFCRGCHAPQADPMRVEEAAASLGVACVTCHVREGAIVTAPGASASASPHAVVRDPELATTAACAGCHQFEFPDAGLRDGNALMQSTVDEHADSRWPTRSCADCHMPREVDGHRSHGFAASRDPDMLRSAVEIAAERTDAETVTVTLRAGRVGHAFPTGDLLRRLEVGAAVVGDDRPAARRYLARHFGRQRQRSGIVLRGELRDDRLPADGAPREVRLHVPNGAGKAVRWWVSYQRVAHQRSFDERDAVIDGEVELSTGVLTGEAP